MSQPLQIYTPSPPLLLPLALARKLNARERAAPQVRVRGDQPDVFRDGLGLFEGFIIILL